MKKFISVVIAAIMLVAASPVHAEDHDFTISKGVLSKYSGIGGEVVVPDGVTKILGSAFKNNDTVTKLVIPDSVTVISEGAFKDCDALTEVVLPNGLKKLNSELFESCDSLKYVVIPETVTDIRSYVFSNCVSLESINIPAGTYGIGGDVFRGCYSLKEINVADGHSYLESFDGILFGKGMKRIICYPAGRTESSYTIPDVVESIYRDAFVKCEYLRELTLPDSFSYIDSGALRCENLEKLNIPKEVVYIDFEYLRSCPKLSALSVEEGNPRYKSVDGVLYSADLKELEFYPTAASGVITVRDGVEVIGAQAFKYCKKITEVILPEGVTKIRDGAFSACSVSSVKLPDSLKVIEPRVFYSSNLQSLYIPEGVESIGEFALDATCLKQFIIPEGVKTIDTYTFGSGNRKMVVVLPRSLEDIDYYRDPLEVKSAMIYCYEDSAFAELFETKKYNVVYMPESDIDGDVNGDVKINLSDVSEIMKFIAERYNSLNMHGSDVNNDGMVNLDDVSLIMKFIAKWDVELK